MSYETITVDSMIGSVGAVISGVDLAKPLTNQAVAEINAAWLKHHVVFFRDQDLTPTQQANFGANFGELDVSVNRQYHGDDFPQIHTVSNLDAAGRPLPVSKLANPGNYFWHTDGSYQSSPPASSLLYGVTIPEAGGTTSFASLYEAHDSLDEARRSRLV